MEKTKHTLGPLPVIEPYVTINGGVVILNGPFPIDQAHRIAKLCKAAPDLLEALKRVERYLQGNRTGAHFEESDIVGIVQTAIAKAEDQGD